MWVHLHVEQIHRSHRWAWKRNNLKIRSSRLPECQHIQILDLVSTPLINQAKQYLAIGPNNYAPEKIWTSPVKRATASSPPWAAKMTLATERGFTGRCFCWKGCEAFEKRPLVIFCFATDVHVVIVGGVPVVLSNRGWMLTGFVPLSHLRIRHPVNAGPASGFPGDI